MAEESDDIILSISADVAALRRSQKKMEETVTAFSKTAEKRFSAVSQTADKNFKSIEQSAKRLRSDLDGVFQKPLPSVGNVLGGIGAALGANELRKMTDTWTDMTSRVNLASGSVEKGTEVMGRLGEMARRTYSDLEQTAESYLSNATALKELGYSTNQSLDYTESLNNALVVSGAKGDRAKRVIDALAKAMAVGKLSGDNLNTVLESGGRVAEALATSLGTTVGGLRGLGAQGKITGNDIVKGLSSQLETLRKEAAAMPATIGDGFTLLNNALLQYVGNADHATGVSAKISEALVIIADNFDKVAGAGLQVAAVFAGALIGRSMGGMIRTLGMTTKAVTDLTRALVAAKGVGDMASALGGLGAAAGPLGAIIGGALVLSVGSYAKASWDAARNSDELRAEMEKLGLIAPKVASGIDEAADALNKLSEADRVRKLKQINDEIERLRNGGGVLGSIFGKGDELDLIASKARDLSLPWRNSKEDKSAYQDLAKLADDFRQFKISAEDARAKLTEINNTKVSKGVVELSDALRGSIDLIAATEAHSVQFGNTLEENIGKVGEEVSNLKAYYKQAADTELISQAQYNELETLLDKFVKTGTGADNLRQQITDIAKASPNLDWVHGQLDGLISKMLVTISTAQAAGRALNMATPRGPDENKQASSANDPYIIQRKAENEAAALFEKNAIRRTKLTKDQLALENKIAEVRKRLETEGIKNPAKGLAERIAKAELEAEKSRTGEGKKPKAEKAHQKTTGQQIDTDIQVIRDRTVALAAETAAVGLSYQENEKRKIALDLEQAALAKLRDEAIKKGQTDLSNIKLSEEHRRKIEEVSAAYAQEAENLRKVRERQEQVEQASADFYETFKSGTLDAITGAKSLSDALSDILNKLSQMLLNAAFDALFKPSSGGNSGGSMGGIFNVIGGLIGRKDGGPVTEVPGGGAIRGAGGPRDDKVLLRASNGEYIMNADATAEYGWLLEAMNKGQLPALRDGGAVGSMIPQIAPASIPMPRMPEMPSTSGGGEGTVSVPISISIDATGADAAGLARVQQQLQRMQQNLPGQIDAQITTSRQRNLKFR